MNKLKTITKVSPWGVSKYFVNKNGTCIITADRGFDSNSKWFVRCQVKYPKCANKEPMNNWYPYEKEVDFPHEITLINCLKDARNEMRKSCIKELTAYHQQKITNLVSL